MRLFRQRQQQPPPPPNDASASASPTTAVPVWLVDHEGAVLSNNNASRLFGEDPCLGEPLQGGVEAQNAEGGDADGM